MCLPRKPIINLINQLAIKVTYTKVSFAMPHPNSPLIIGTGAMACLFAGRLAAADLPVSMLGTWQAGLDALRRSGVTLIEKNGSESTFPVRVFTNPTDFRNVRFALVLVKSWQTERAAHQLSECLTHNGVALTLQNGLGNREVLSKVLGPQRVVLGATTLGANLLSPGRVQSAGDGVISLSPHPHLAPLAELLRSAGFLIEDISDPDELLWAKLVINAAINPLTAILRVPNGEILSRPTAHALLVSLSREAAAVAGAFGIHLPYPDPVVATETIAHLTASNRSSMLQDIARCAPTEIDAICGAIVLAGEQVNLPTPVNRTMWQLIKAMTNSQLQE
jgi:2-dehydropantoate 2-reductase